MKTNIIGKILLIYITTSVVVGFCEESLIATKLGYTNRSEKAMVGPYSLEYGECKENNLFLLAKGKHNIISIDGNATDVYQKGRPWFHFDTNANGVVTNMSITFVDTYGKPIKMLLDENADGEWDIKIDMISKQVFERQKIKMTDNISDVGVWTLRTNLGTRVSGIKK